MPKDDATLSAASSGSHGLPEAEIDALEYVVHQGVIGAYDRPVLLAWLARLQRTPAEPSAPGEGTRQAECTLTDEERKALKIAVEYVGSAYAVEHHAETIRKLLARLS